MCAGACGPLWGQRACLPLGWRPTCAGLTVALQGCSRGQGRERPGTPKLARSTRLAHEGVLEREAGGPGPLLARSLVGSPSPTPRGPDRG